MIKFLFFQQELLFYISFFHIMINVVIFKVIFLANVVNYNHLQGLYERNYPFITKRKFIFKIN